MKKALIALIIVVLLYPLVAWLMGFAIENRVESLTDQGQQVIPQLHLLQKSKRAGFTSDADSSYELGPTLKLTRHYHRGWYTSVDDTDVEMSSAMLNSLSALGPAAATAANAEPLTSPIRYSLHTVIHHGPFCGLTCFALARADTHVTFTDTLRDSLTKLFGNKNPITIVSRFAFSGGGSTTISSPSFDHAKTDHDTFLSWGGIEATFHYGARQEWYDLTASAPALNVQGPKGTIEAEAMSLDMRAKRVVHTLYASDSHMKLKHFAATDADKVKQLSIDDVVFTSQDQVQDRFMNVNYQWSAGAIQSRSMTLSSAHADFTWKHLGLDALESFSVAMRSSYQQQNQLHAPAAQAQDMLAALKQPLTALLLEEPEMDVDRLSMAAAQGQATMTGAIHLAGFSASDLDAPMLLIPKLDVRLDTEIDESFLASLPGVGADALTKLQPMIDQGFVTRANGTLRTQLLFQRGQLTFNGKPFSPGGMTPGKGGGH